MKSIAHLTVLTLLFSGTLLVADELGWLPEMEPEAILESDYAALKQTSPFTRVLSLSESYALRGVATIGGERVATLYNRETKKTVVVTPEGDNEWGISLVEIIPARELEGVAAKIAFAGDEAELKYEESQLSPEPRRVSGAKGSRSSGDSSRRPAPQDVERFRSLSEEKQAKLREYIGHVMRNYPDMSREERGNLIRGAMVRLTDGRDLEMPPANTQGSKGGKSKGGNSEAGGPPRSNTGRSSNGEGRSREGNSGNSNRRPRP